MSPAKSISTIHYRTTNKVLEQVGRVHVSGKSPCACISPLVATLIVFPALQGICWNGLVERFPNWGLVSCEGCGGPKGVAM